MGWGQSKPAKEEHNAIAIAQVHAVSAQVDNKLNILGILLIVVSVAMMFMLCFVIRAKCKNYARKWLSKTIKDLPHPVSVQVQSIPATSQQPKIF